MKSEYLAQYCVNVGVYRGALYLAPRGIEGGATSAAPGPGWQRCTAPEGPEFLAVVNKALGTHFRMSDFIGVPGDLQLERRGHNSRELEMS